MNTRDQKASIMGRGTVFPLGVFTPGEMRGMLGLYPQYGVTEAPPAPPAAVVEDALRPPAWVWKDRRRFKAHRMSPLVWKWR